MILRDPAVPLDPRVRRLWALQWLGAALVVAVAAVIASVLLAMADNDRAALVVGGVGGVVTLALVAAAVLQPRLAYRSFRYEITELGLYVAGGRLWRKWQVVPHSRVQTVDTKRGPLERALGLVSVFVTTASAKGGTGIPGLDPAVADALVEELRPSGRDRRGHVTGVGAAERGRLHPLAILVFARRVVGPSLIPVLVVAFTWRPAFVVPGLVALVAAGAALVIAEWRRFTYRIENGRLVIERGVFRHSTRVVALDRIRGVELQAPWLHRVLGLVRVDVEAAAGGKSAAELSLAAVTAAEGERLRGILLAGRGAAASASEGEAAETALVLYRATPRLLAIGGITSGRHILAPLAIIGVVANFADDLPGGFVESFLESAAESAPTDALGVSLLVVAAIAVAAAFAAAGSLVTDWDFQLEDDGERLVARRGLLTRRAVVIDRARVRGLDLRDSPLRRAFGLVGIHAVAGGIEGRAGRTVLAPVVRSAAAKELVRAVDPPATPDGALERHPRAARTRRVVRAVALPALLAAIAFGAGSWWPAVLLLALLPLALLLGIDRYRQLGHSFDGDRLSVREGSLSRRRTSLDPAGIVAYAVERTPFQARAGLCTVVFHLGQGAGSRRVLDCSEEQAAALLAELDAPLLRPLVAPAPA